MTVKYKNNSKEMIKWLRQKAGRLEEVSANTLNLASRNVEHNYRKILKTEFLLKNNFTLKSILTLRATGRRRTGEIRKMHKINAIVGIRFMKGGKEHYMLKQEIGGIQRGSSKTQNKVPIPLEQARTSSSKRKPITSKYRMIAKKTQTLKLGGRRFGYNDSTKSGHRLNPRQRWAIINKYKRTNKLGDLKKPFFFENSQGQRAIFAKKGNQFRTIRTLNKSSVTIKARHPFERAINTLTPARMEKFFMISARKYLGR